MSIPQTMQDASKEKTTMANLTRNFLTDLQKEFPFLKNWYPEFNRTERPVTLQIKRVLDSNIRWGVEYGRDGVDGRYTNGISMVWISNGEAENLELIPFEQGEINPADILKSDTKFIITQFDYHDLLTDQDYGHIVYTIYKNGQETIKEIDDKCKQVAKSMFKELTENPLETLVSKLQDINPISNKIKKFTSMEEFLSLLGIPEIANEDSEINEATLLIIARIAKNINEAAIRTHDKIFRSNFVKKINRLPNDPNMTLFWNILKTIFSKTASPEEERAVLLYLQKEAVKKQMDNYLKMKKKERYPYQQLYNWASNNGELQKYIYENYYSKE